MQNDKSFFQESATLKQPPNGGRCLPWSMFCFDVNWSHVKKQVSYPTSLYCFWSNVSSSNWRAENRYLNPALKNGSLIHQSSYKMRCSNLSKWSLELSKALLHLVWDAQYISLREDGKFSVYRSINNTVISWNQTECVSKVRFVKADTFSFKIKQVNTNCPGHHG